MAKNLLKIDPVLEKKKIVKFIKKTLQKQGFKNVVLGMSGGIDSVTCFYLLKEAVAPENIFLVHLPYFGSSLKNFKSFLEKAKIPDKNIYDLPIKSTVGGIKQALRIPDDDKIRLGNVMARIRMIMLYDLAKKHQALVCGTENKSEFYLGYFTRFGDAASDFEPIRHLYKTQVYQLADCLNLPRQIIALPPTAGLWPGQTDETDFGFSYSEADAVLYLFQDKKIPIAEIAKMNLPNAEKIINYVCRNSFKHKLPYTL